MHRLASRIIPVPVVAAYTTAMFGFEFSKQLSATGSGASLKARIRRVFTVVGCNAPAVGDPPDGLPWCEFSMKKRLIVVSTRLDMRRSSHTVTPTLSWSARHSRGRSLRRRHAARHRCWESRAR